MALSYFKKLYCVLWRGKRRYFVRYFNVDVLIRKDRTNEGASVGEAVNILEQIYPEYSRKQLDQAFRRTVRPQYSERMTDPFAVQATTTKRTAITPAQQWRWHKVKY